jgi:IS1 family transposase
VPIKINVYNRQRAYIPLFLSSASFVIGDRSSAAAEKCWETIRRHEMKQTASDYWKPY